MLEAYENQNFTPSTSMNVSQELVNIFKRRRTIRHFSQQTPPIEVVENAIRVAGLAPSGANKQPWHFHLIKSFELKQQIRVEAEKVERDFYEMRPNQNWVQDLKPLKTNAQKEFLTQAPYLIVIFYRHFDVLEEDGFFNKSINYYAKESTGIATGLLLSALHLSGLNTLTYTPKKMQFLSELFAREKHERPFMIIATGLAQDGAQIPKIHKKSLEDILSIYK